MATKKVNIDIVARDKSKQALRGVRSSLDSVKKSIFNVRNAFIGLGAGLAIRSIVNTGKEIEGLQVRLKFLFGTAEEGAKAFDKMAEFAGKVPFSLAEIQRGAGVLAVVSKDANELSNIMKITGNVAAVTGLDFKTTAEQIQRSLSAGISAADLFRDRGVKAMLGFKAGAKVSVEETVEAFERVFGEGGKFDGATDQLAQTFEGTLSMIGDKIFNFKRTILEAGFFPELKKQFKDLDNFLANQSDALDKMAIKIGKGLAIAVKNLADAIIFVKENVDLFAGALGTLIALKVAGFFYATTTALAGLTAGMKAFNFATKKNIIFGSIMVFASAMGFLISKFKEFKGELSTEFDNKSIKELNEELSQSVENLKKYEKQGAAGLPKVAQEYKNQEILIALIAEKTKELNIENGFYIQQMRDSVKLVNANNEANKDATKTLTEYKNALVGLMIQQARLEDKQVGMSARDYEAIEKAQETSLQKRLQQYKSFVSDMGFEQDRMLDEQVGLTVEAMKKIQEEVEKQNRTTWSSFKQGFKEAMDVDIFEKFEEIGKKTFDSLTKMLTDFVTTGKMNFQDFARVVIRMITEALIGQAVQYAINKSIEMFKASALRKAMINVYKGALETFASIPFPFNIAATGAAIGFGMNLVKKITGFEKGGRPPVNQPSIVGEAGPELFVPNSAGTIIPNNQLGGGKPVTVNFNINTVDARGFNELLVNSRGVIVNMINSAVNEKGRQAII